MRSTSPEVFLRIATLTVVLVLTGSGAGADLEDEKPLDLFQKVARADLIIRARTYDGSLRFALVDVEESLKGSPPARRLRVAFRDYNFARRPGIDPIVFPSGQEEILFLSPYEASRRKDKNKDLYNLYLGSEGRITIPAEGAGAILEAIRTLAAVSAQGPASQIESLEGMLESPNTFLVEAALDEISRMHAAGPEFYGRASKSLSSPSPGLRIRALRIIQAVFLTRPEEQDSGGAGAHDDLPDQGPMILQSVIERARNDSSNGVRAAAVDAMAAWPKWSEVEADLKAIAAKDQDQEVRYAAERALLQHRPRSAEP
jgi:hypothetical protein